MGRRRKPRSLIDYLAYVAVSLVATWALYEMRLHFAEQRIERAQEQFAKLAPVAAPAPRVAAYQPTEAEIRRAHAQRTSRLEQARAAQARQAAWERFYQPPRTCLYPENERRIAICRANEQKQREAFEVAWTKEGRQ